jgi:hypothetical protein
MNTLYQNGIYKIEYGTTDGRTKPAGSVRNKK